MRIRDTKAENGEKIFIWIWWKIYSKICGTHILLFVCHRCPPFYWCVYFVNAKNKNIFTVQVAWEVRIRNDGCIRSTKLLICMYPNRIFEWISFVRLRRLKGRRSRFFISLSYYSIQTSVFRALKCGKRMKKKKKKNQLTMWDKLGAGKK